jgi:hypothetical protein
MLFTVASEANSFAAISALDKPGGRRLRERQIDLLYASPAMAATVLAGAPNQAAPCAFSLTTRITQRDGGQDTDALGRAVPADVRYRAAPAMLAATIGGVPV